MVGLFRAAQRGGGQDGEVHLHLDHLVGEHGQDDNLSSSSYLCLVPPHLLEDGEVNVDLMDAGILLFQAKRKEEFCRISSPHLAKLELLLTFSWPEAPASTTSHNLEAKIAASVLEQHRGWLVEKAEADLLTRSKQALKGGGSVRESVHLNHHY